MQASVCIIHIMITSLQGVERHKPSDQILDELEGLLSRLNAMEIMAKDEFQKNTVQILRALVRGQIHATNEFEHLKKAIDLVTLQLFDTQNRLKS